MSHVTCVPLCPQKVPYQNMQRKMACFKAREASGHTCTPPSQWPRCLKNTGQRPHITDMCVHPLLRLPLSQHLPRHITYNTHNALIAHNTHNAYNTYATCHACNTRSAYTTYTAPLTALTAQTARATLTTHTRPAVHRMWQYQRLRAGGSKPGWASCARDHSLPRLACSGF